ncbi:winged helix-turn-helix domain-containing protein [Lysobacter sp. FW306-1B-D06B]|uniref:winged helix-turn-helix domain-containing protein n=1 Tax=Lysobacter sp. FW306-1B-D06B TaxID=3140250 RepID=UPI00314032DB
MRLPIYRFGEFELDPAARELRRRGERVPLPPKSFDSLAYLIAHRERAVGRDELIAAVWGRVDITDTVVAQTMLRARKALGDQGESSQCYVRTVPRFGYHWVTSVEEIWRAPVATATPPTSVEPATPAREENAARPHARPWRVLVLVASIAGIALAGLMTGRALRTPQAPRAEKAVANAVLVLPVTVAHGEAEDAWVRLGAMDYMASRLRHGGLPVVPSEQALHLSAMARAQSLDVERAAQLGEIADARWVVAPQAERDARGWRVRLTVFEAGREKAIEARGTSALAATAAAVNAWLRRVHPENMRSDPGPSDFDQRLQQIDAELLAGQLDAARQLIESVPPDARAQPALRVREGQLAFRTGRVDEAAAIFQETLARTGLTPEVRARTLMGQGAVEIRRGEAVRAERHYTEALKLLPGLARVDDPTMAGNAYNGLGVALVLQGRMNEAVLNMGMARVEMQRSGNLIEAASVGANLGMIEQQRRHYPQAMQEFDRAIDVFERFDVRDHMAAALMAKAGTQLDMVQADAAAASIARARSLMGSLEDRVLSARIAALSARINLMRGRLRDASRDIARLRALDTSQQSDGMTARELEMRALLVRGDAVGAARLARASLPRDAFISGGLSLTAVQAALAMQDEATSSRWLAYRDRIPAAQRSVDWDIAEALLAQSRARTRDALSKADGAVARAESTGSPDERVQTGVFKARLLRMQGNVEAAVPVLGDLDAFAARDYRVAWETLAVYRVLRDEAMSRAASARVQALRGERDPAIVPAL